TKAAPGKPGATTTLNWGSNYATSCRASDNWSGTKAVSGSQTLAPTASSAYTLTCTGSGGSTTQRVSVTVKASGSTPAVNQNPVTQNVTASAAARAAVPIKVSASDPDGDALSYAI